MWYEKEKVKMEDAAKKMAQILVGKKIVSVEMPVSYPGQYSCVKVVFEDGTEFEVGSGGGGCSECDPEGIGHGVDVDLTPA
jgi:hypothetical protein